MACLKRNTGESMKIETFLNELMFYFPLKGYDKEEEVNKYLDLCASDIDRFVKQYGENFECDYNTVLFELRTHYTFRNFPPIAEIVKYIPKAIKSVPKPLSYSGQEGTVIKRVIYGCEYEFTIVPNHWEGVKTIQLLDTQLHNKKFVLDKNKTFNET